MKVYTLSFSVSEISVLVNPSCVVGCQRLGKQLKVPHTGRAAPIVNEVTSVFRTRNHSLGNATEGRMHEEDN